LPKRLEAKPLEALTRELANREIEKIISGKFGIARRRIGSAFSVQMCTEILKP